MEYVELEDVAYGADEDTAEVPAPPEAIEDERYPELKGPTDDRCGRDELTVPVGPAYVVEFEIPILYGADEDTTEEIPAPEAIEDERYPEVKGPTVERCGRDE
jgi:hypothetical protein